MATNPEELLNINSDLTPEAQAGDRVPQQGDVETVEIPESDVGTWDPFGTDEPSEAEQLFDESPEEINYRGTVLGVHRPVAASLLALALSDPSTTNNLTLMSEANLEAARQLLDEQQEYNARLQVSQNRAIDTMKHVDRLRTQFEERAKIETVPAETMDLINRAYEGVMARDREQDARTAIEMEAIDRVRGFLAQNDPHEAWLVNQQAFGNGTAERVIMEEATKSLIVMQRLEELEAKYNDSGWIRGFFNGVIRAVPFLDSFSAAGILDDAGIANESGGGLVNFILRGSGLVQQREALWGLPLDQFAEALAPNGAVMKAIEQNAAWLMSDPARALEVGSLLLAHEQPSPHLENVFGGLDAAFTAVPAGGRLLGTLKGLGARSAAVDQTTKAILETISKGSDAAKASTGLNPVDISEAMTPNVFMNQPGVSLGTDVAASLKTAEDMRNLFPEILAVHRMDSAEDIRAAYQVYEQELKNTKHGDHIKDVKYVQESIRTGQVSEFADEVVEDGATVYKLEVTLGKKEGGGYSKPSYVEGLFERFGRQGEVYKDPETGQYFGRMEVAVRMDGFITNPLETPDARMAFLRSSARTADRKAVDKGILAGNSANRFLKQVETTLKASVKGIPRKERNALNQVIMKGQNEAKWYDETEFAIHYERLHGSYPTASVQQAYDTYRAMHDMVYLIRNDAVYLNKYNQGYESHTFRMAGRDVDLDGVVNRDPSRRPLGQRMWDASNDRWLADNISADEIKKMVDEGYVMVRLDSLFDFPDGRVARHIMIKQSDLTTRPLRRTQLNYSQGGSRAYDATHFIKQAAEDVDGNLINPRTWIAGKNLNEMKAWADDMNKALELRRAGETDLLKYEDIFLARPGYPTPQEFLDMVDQRQLSLKHNFEVVEDTKLPSAYFEGKDPQLMRYVDLDQTALDSYHDTMGRMYYGTKGEHLKDTTGNFAETIDPWNSLNSTVTEASKTYSFSGYKQNMLERFKNTYGAYLDLDNLAQADSLYALANAPIKRDLPKDVAGIKNVENKIRNEQAAIKRLMNFETGFEKWARENWRAAAEWILGDASAKSLRGRGKDAMYWLEKNNPVQFLRTVTFDSNLGFWNPSQLFIQTSTIASAMALHGDKSLKGIRTIYPLKTYAVSGYRDDVLDVLAKRGVWEGSFDSEDEFKLFMRTMRDTGLYEVGGHNLAMIREYGANKVFGASSVYDAVSEKGRMFFYFAEQANRSVAARIAWDDIMEAGLKPGTTQFRERFAGLTDDYSFNMMSQTSASFQHGLPSIPTQFWAYGFRMMDALMGSRFTKAQKARLLIANATMAGAAGVPGFTIIKSLYEHYKGEPVSMDEVDGWLARGLFDGLAYVLTGSDVEIGVRIGTAEQLQNIIKDLFGQGDFGQKSVFDTLLGASGGKLKTAIPALWDVIYWNASEVTGDTQGLAKDSWFQLAKEIATARHAYNAAMAYRYQSFWSRSGTLVKDNLPTADAFFYAMGFTPGAQSAQSFYYDAMDESDLDEAAKQLSKWRQDAFTHPDLYETNRQKAQAFMALFTPSERKKIREKAYRAVDRSMLETLQRRWEKEQVESEFYNEMVPMIEEKVEQRNGR